jgi:hypothetical protein
LLKAGAAGSGERLIAVDSNGSSADEGTADVSTIIDFNLGFTDY